MLLCKNTQWKPACVDYKAEVKTCNCNSEKAFLQDLYIGLHVGWF